MTAVRTPDGVTPWFELWAGVLQGDTLAPYPFVLVVEVMLRHVMEGKSGCHFESFGVLKALTDLDYADDLALLASTKQQAQGMLTCLVATAATYGLQVNFSPGKTEELALSEPHSRVV